jgi:hypothetical protein
MPSLRILAASGNALQRVKSRPIRSTFSIFATRFDLTHKRLDDAVFAAYGWQPDLTDEEIVEKLLGLNLERSKTEDHF